MTHDEARQLESYYHEPKAKNGKNGKRKGGKNKYCRVIMNKGGISIILYALDPRKEDKVDRQLALFKYTQRAAGQVLPRPTDERHPS